MRGYKSILLLLFLAVNAYALTPNENITNIAASVKASTIYSAGGSAAGLTNVQTIRQTLVDEWDWRKNFSLRTNESPWVSDYGLTGDAIRVVTSPVGSFTNGIVLTNGFIASSTNEVFYYWNRATTLPVQRVEAYVRFSTNGMTSGNPGDNSQVLIIAAAVPIQSGVGVSGYFLHLTFNEVQMGGSLYSNGLTGPVVNFSIDPIPVGLRPKPGDIVKLGWEILANGRGDTINIFMGGITLVGQSDFLTNLFAPGIGLATNVIFELSRKYPSHMHPEFQSFAYTTKIGDAYPYGIKAKVNAAGEPLAPEITATNLSIGTVRFFQQSNGDFFLTNASNGQEISFFTGGGDADITFSPTLNVSMGGMLFSSVGFAPNDVSFWRFDANTLVYMVNTHLFRDANNVSYFDATSTLIDFYKPVGIRGSSTSAVHTATSLIAGGGGIASATTNATLTMAAGGITNTTAIQYTIYGFTGTGVVLTNLSRPINITLGTITAPATIVLQPNDALMGTLCSAAGDRGF